MRKQSWVQTVAANSKSGGVERTILLIMAAGCAPDGTICLSFPEIAFFAKCSPSTARRSTRKLCKTDELWMMERETRGRGQPICYRIRVKDKVLYHAKERRSYARPPLLEEKATIAVTAFPPLQVYKDARACGELQEDVPSAPASDPSNEQSPFCQEAPAIYAKVAFE